MMRMTKMMMAMMLMNDDGHNQSDTVTANDSDTDGVIVDQNGTVNR